MIPNWVWGVCVGLTSAFCGAMGGILIRKSFSGRRCDGCGSNDAPHCCACTPRPREEDSFPGVPPEATKKGKESNASPYRCNYYEDVEDQEMAEPLSAHPSRGGADDVVAVASSGGGANCTTITDSNAKAAHSICSLLKSPEWLAGMVLTTVINPAGTIAALALAPATLVTSMAGCHVLFNMILAKLLLKEHAKPLDYVGSVGVAAGMCLVVAFSGKDQPVSSADAYLLTLTETNAIVYICVMLGLLLCTIVLSSNTVALRLISGNTGTAIQRLCLCLTSGLAAGNSNLAAKGVVMSVSELGTVGIQAVACRVFPYVALVCTGVLALTQIVYLNWALKVHTALFVVPTTNSVLIIIGAIGAIVILLEDPISVPLFALGLVCIICGIFCLSADESAIRKRCCESCTGAGRTCIPLQPLQQQRAAELERTERLPQPPRMFTTQLDDRLITSLASRERHLQGVELLPSVDRQQRQQR
eukprot:GHVU01060572.1.p1 GENE.GHVU01060572.1~~GHVU01060572.1.p1  ORF type:complete len:474 (-),score=60.41 GHVU01060572.1:41-1462(-)